MIYGRLEKLTDRLRSSSAMKMAKIELKNVIDDATLKMANSKV
jgi:hypothetical protein